LRACDEPRSRGSCPAAVCAGASSAREPSTCQGLEGREAVTIVVDDTSAVWAAHAGNLLAVERYIYFPSSRRQFGLRGKALLEVNRRARPMAARMALVSWGRVRVRVAGSGPLLAAEL